MPAMNHRFASRCTQVAESGTTRIFTLAKQLQQQGREIINLAVGEPHFETAAPIIQATQATRFLMSDRLNAASFSCHREFQACSSGS